MIARWLTDNVTKRREAGGGCIMLGEVEQYSKMSKQGKNILFTSGTSVSNTSLKFGPFLSGKLVFRPILHQFDGLFI